MSLIIKRFGIQYPNGIYQEKTLISHGDFLDIFKPVDLHAYELDVNKRKDEASVIKSSLNVVFGEHWFTDKSPLFIGEIDCVLIPLKE